MLIAGIGGCDRTCTATIEGSIGEFTKGDKVYATLSRNWRKTEKPTVFSMYTNGGFRLVLKVDGKPPVVTLVKNGEKYAELAFKDLWRYYPTIVDKVSGRKYELRIDGKGNVFGEVRL